MLIDSASVAVQSSIIHSKSGFSFYLEGKLDSIVFHILNYIISIGYSYYQDQFTTYFFRLTTRLVILSPDDKITRS